MIFCQCQGQGFLTMSLGKAFLRGQQVSCHCYVSLDAYCCHLLHSFYVVSSLEGGHCVMIHPYRPLVEIRDRFKEKMLFLEIYNFDTKINNTGRD